MRATLLFLPLSLVTVPGAISLGIWASAPFVLWLDAGILPDWPSWAVPDFDAAVALLSTLASAAITTLSLVYSIMLVVFTLAAGNIAPRLLRRFSDDRANQITAGLLGGTFLFSLTVLHWTEPGGVPSLGLFLAVVLMALSVLQLIYFVHSVSDSVSIDSEVARISVQFDRNVRTLLPVADGRARPATDAGPVDGPTLGTTRAGYVSGIDEDALIALARRRDIRIEVLLRTGEFAVRGQPILRVSRPLDPDDAKDALDAVALRAARGAHEDIDYSLGLLLEIALRALSPGVNDTFTAIACADHIGAALVGPLRDGVASAERCDADGVPRLRRSPLTLPMLFGLAFDPLRAAAARNMLMARHLAFVLLRLAALARPEALPHLRHHARLLLADASHGANPDDADRLAELLAPLASDTAA